MRTPDPSSASGRTALLDDAGHDRPDPVSATAQQCKVPPDRRPRANVWSQLLMGLTVFAGYSVVASWIPFQGRALGNARALLAAERFLHIDVERAMNDWLAHQGWLRIVANYEYAWVYVISAFATLIWVYLRRVEIYRLARNSFVIMNVLAIVCFAVFPVTPPRLLPAGFGYHDTVRDAHTAGSWGSSLVAHANDLAAMPSLHVAWALWVTLVLSRVAASRKWFAASVAHIAITVLVILSTGNHYVLDAAGAVVLTAISSGLARRHDLRRRRRGDRIPAADAFFLHVDSPRWPQQVGGFALLDDDVHRLTRAELTTTVRAELHRLPRFRQRVTPGTSWWRPSWCPVEQLDWDWHVAEEHLHHAGPAALDALAARLSTTPLPRDRPLWRVWIVHDVTPGRSALVYLVHHTVADGFGTIAQALHFMRPELDTAPRGRISRPGPVVVALATARGLAELALARRPKGRPPTGGEGRTFVSVPLEFEAVRSTARSRGVTVTDLVLTVVAGAVARLGTSSQTEMRTSVPIMVRDPRDTASHGNVTATVMLDVPVAAGPDTDRLSTVAGRSRVLRSGTRALAARWVMGPVSDLLPAAIHGRFARTVYGRRTFHAIVSNLPGPDRQLSVGGSPMVAAYPLLPLAPEAPIAIGALSWGGQLCVGFMADPVLAPDHDALRRALLDTLDELRGPVQPTTVGGDLQHTS